MYKTSLRVWWGEGGRRRGVDMYELVCVCVVGGGGVAGEVKVV